MSGTFDIRSDVAGIDWPPISIGQNAVLLALLRQFEETQWLSADTLASMQRRQLGQVAAHAEIHSPFFRTRLAQAGLTARDLAEPGGLQRLPVLRRRDVQGAPDFFCDAVPKGHSPVGTARTSGSTGEPVVIRRTAINRFDWFALALREHLWHGRAPAGRFCAIRASTSKPVRSGNWGPPFASFTATGPSLSLPITLGTTELIDRLREFAPQCLLVYPGTLAALLHADASALGTVRHLQTIGETVSPALRDAAQARLGIAIADAYSSEETGYIACQCPVSGLYHTMAETLIVEILRADGTPCGQGEAGRVVVTDLRNFATPLIRYDIGDVAEPGPPCACGRGLPTLTRVLGRERNLIRMPDGTRHWPLVGFAQFRDIAPVAQYQLVQDGRESIEVRLVTERPLTPDEERRLGAHIQNSLGHAFALRFVYFEGAIPLGANGKFEEFICRVD